MNIVETVPENKRDEITTCVEQLRAGELVKSFATQRVTRDGRTLDIWLTVTKLTDENGTIYGIATTERDITGKPPKKGKGSRS